MNFYKKVVLTTLEIPPKKLKKDRILKITVLKKDNKMELFIDKIKLYLAVSGIP